MSEDTDTPLTPAGDIDSTEAGGFIPDDSNYASNKRRRSARVKQQSYKEPSDHEDNEEDFVKVGNNSSNKKRKTTRATAPKPKSAAKSRSRAKIEDDEDEDDEDFIIKNDENDEDDDLEVLAIDRSTRNGSSADNAISLTDVEDDDDVPLANKKPKTPAKKKGATKKKPAKKKEPKVKIPYFTRATNRLYEHHPELKDVFPYLQSLDKVKVERAEQPPGMNIKLLPFQLEGLNWLIKQEAGEFAAGVLADEMGMGKTIQVIALLMTDLLKRPNLVVGPTVALMQWKNEIEAHTTPGF